ncbi:TRAP transporter substrate-binding protein [Azospirillum sp. SYSU D00513]|uniref:TRAP transporter substrate-binding protein n=1 Tax=Azospirillum sp. SYSU D00513 TaxID=2812561 RepID=UPI001A95918F|nr:TRAP transporter substrate-binding protein [Azospirillum sp. SYSU D00513]
MKFSFERLCVAAVAAIALMSGGAFAQETRTAKLGHAHPMEHAQAKAMIQFAQDVEAATNKRVKINVFHSASLGGDDKQLQAVQTGVQEFYIGALAPLAGKIQDVRIFDFPFMFNNLREVEYVFNGPVGRKILDKLEPMGMVGLGWSHAGFRELSNRQRPVTKAEDIAGLKVRVMQNPVALETWKALGANAVPMSFSEVFTALETGSLDGQENPLQHMHANKMFEVQKYVTLTNHVYTPVTLLASKKFWDQLTPADQDAVRKAAAGALALQNKLIAEGDDKAIAELKKEGMTLTEMPPEEIAKLQAKVQPVVEKYTKEIGPEFVNEFRAEIEKARKAQ